ncbi:hypothetical protein NQ318_008633 [Aromia moschata]|uniref:TRIP4/RQT4 C2HC5-type zinc finger domain-containing protein n=1 Tax=Aromia moschata TaxID=1265417 RepID=A0AAV8YVZ7_9CUCU|nr:hypothetical protein NQ318_008633 [Aromia moschata]
MSTSQKSSQFNHAQREPLMHKKGKTKFKNINAYQEKKKEKDGRSPCDCLGQEHEFMNNCLVCGRIHCMEEGPGPCLFCGNMVHIRGEESFDTSSKKQKAIMKPRENKVFDDDNDYFKINSKKHGDKESKQKMIIALDFLPHNVNDDLVNLLIQMRHKKPLGQEDLGQEDSTMLIIDYGTRVFDEDLMASRRRSWPTTHRGRLWIAAAAKAADDDEIDQVESFYREYYQDSSLSIPKGIPYKRCSRMCNREDCLDQEVYRKKYPKGESNSPFVLICSNSIISPIFYPIRQTQDISIGQRAT